MHIRVLQSIIGEFNRIAKVDKLREPEPYIVDVFVSGAAGYTNGSTATMFTGSVIKLDDEWRTLEMDVLQYGEGRDFNKCYLHVDSIVAIRMRKPG